MKKIASLLLLTGALIAMQTAQTRNEKYVLPIAVALRLPLATAGAETDGEHAAESIAGVLDGSVAFYYGSQEAPAAQERLGSVALTAKARISGGDDVGGCNRAFQNAMQKIQTAAKKAGANAVINIATYFKSAPPLRSTTEFECHVGHSAALMIQGDLVRLETK